MNHELEYRRGFVEPGLVPWLEGEDPQSDGERLFGLLMKDDRVKAAWAEVRGRAPQRRLRLRLDGDAPELHAIPWELIRDPGSDAAHDIAASVRPHSPATLPASGSQAAPSSGDRSKSSSCWRILPILQNAAWRPWAPERIAALVASTQGLEVQLIRLPEPCTLPAIEAAVKQGCHIVHFIGHGSYDERNGAVLYLADTSNSVTPAHSDKLAAMLPRQLADSTLDSEDKMRLVYLSSCQTASRTASRCIPGVCA